ncbi:MAG: hypothetical protein ACOYL6_05410 [Bacteriovoracaceae bacterium]
MKNLLLLVVIFLFSVAAWACPGCAGGSADGKSINTVWILSIFILLTYIPFYLLFRITKKYDVNKNTSSKVP